MGDIKDPAVSSECIIQGEMRWLNGRRRGDVNSSDVMEVVDWEQPLKIYADGVARTGGESYRFVTELIVKNSHVCLRSVRTLYLY
jgi:hypothetical protein